MSNCSALLSLIQIKLFFFHFFRPSFFPDIFSDLGDIGVGCVALEAGVECLEVLLHVLLDLPRLGLQLCQFVQGEHLTKCQYPPQNYCGNSLFVSNSLACVHTAHIKVFWYLHTASLTPEKKFKFDLKIIFPAKYFSMSTGCQRVLMLWLSWTDWAYGCLSKVTSPE